MGCDANSNFTNMDYGILELKAGCHCQSNKVIETQIIVFFYYNIDMLIILHIS